MPGAQRRPIIIQSEEVPMKALAAVLTVLGIIGLAWAVAGRFIGEPTVQGFQAVNVLIGANSLLLLAILCKLNAR